MRRERDLARLEGGGAYDLLVVGGGAAGAATLRAAALGGLRAALCERADFAAGTTSRSSRLIHGGLRYLEHGHLRLVIEALHERSVLIRIAPHLVEPLAIHVPLYRGGRRGPWRVRLGLWLYERLAGRAGLGRSELLAAGQGAERLPGLATDGLMGVGLLWDARVRLPERLVVESLVDAERLGAVAVNRLELVRAEPRAGRWTATLRDRVADREFRVDAGAILNAGGPWVGEIDGRLGACRPSAVQWSRGSHLLLAPFPGAPAHAILVEARRDGRPFFILPSDGYLLIGTTEVPHAGTPARVRVGRQEAEYLLEEFAHVWPGAAGRRPYASYAGLRPLPPGRDAAAADRRHRLIAHGPRGLFTLLGGKLTTQRLAGEEVVQRVARYLGRRPPAADLAARRELPGAQCDPDTPAFDAAALASRGDLPTREAQALLCRWGCRAWALATGLRGARPIAGAGGLWPEEIRFAIELEGAHTLDDVLLRRTGVGFEPGLTRAGIEEAARVWAWVRSGGRPDRDAPRRQSALPPWSGLPEVERRAAAEAARVADLLRREYERVIE